MASIIPRKNASPFHCPDNISQCNRLCSLAVKPAVVFHDRASLIPEEMPVGRQVGWGYGFQGKSRENVGLVSNQPMNNRLRPARSLDAQMVAFGCHGQTGSASLLE
jgi:hypothetical protein